MINAFTLSYKDNKLENVYRNKQIQELLDFYKKGLFLTLTVFVIGVIYKATMGNSVVIELPSLLFVIQFGLSYVLLSKYKPHWTPSYLTIINIIIGLTSFYKYVLIQVTYDPLQVLLESQIVLLVQLFLLRSPRYLENLFTWIIISAIQLAISMIHSYFYQQAYFVLFVLLYSCTMYQQEKTKRTYYFYSQKQDEVVHLIKNCVQQDCLLMCGFDVNHNTFTLQCYSENFIQLFRTDFKEILRECKIMSHDYKQTNNQSQNLENYIWQVLQANNFYIQEHLCETILVEYQDLQNKKTIIQVTINIYCQMEAQILFNFVVQDDQNSREDSTIHKQQQTLLLVRVSKIALNSFQNQNIKIKKIIDSFNISKDLITHLEQFRSQNIIKTTKMLSIIFEMKKPDLAIQTFKFDQVLKQIVNSISIVSKKKLIQIIQTKYYGNEIEAKSDPKLFSFYVMRILQQFIQMAQKQTIINIFFEIKDVQLQLSIVRVLSINIILLGAYELKTQKLWESEIYQLIGLTDSSEEINIINQQQCQSELLFPIDLTLGIEIGMQISNKIPTEQKDIQPLITHLGEKALLQDIDASYQ